MKAKGLTKETVLDLGTQKRDFDSFRIGDTVSVSQWIKEGEKNRLQVFQGDVIAEHINGISSTFTVRKISASGVAVEKIFPYYSPRLESVEKVRSAKVRRAKLYYIRDRVGRSGRLQEKVLTREQKEQMAHTTEENSEPISQPTNNE
jgi:large subunit ribosomal protein L19